jgi:hypothetical protein
MILEQERVFLVQESLTFHDLMRIGVSIRWRTRFRISANFVLDRKFDTSGTCDAKDFPRVDN